MLSKIILDGEVALTLVLMDTYTTLMILIGHWMRLPLTKLENIAMIVITTPPLPSLLCLLFLVRPGGYTLIHSEFVCLLFLQTHRETDLFFVVSGVQPAQSTSVLYRFKRAVFSSQIKSKWDNILTKTASLRITLDIDDAPVTSRSHTHPSHSQTARLLTSSMFLGITVPHTTTRYYGSSPSVYQSCTSLTFSF
jgi:hypothetical protein